MSLEELLEIIHKSKFSNLLNMRHLKLVYTKHENRGGVQENVSVGFESNKCKLGLHCEAMIGIAMIAKSSDWEKAEWLDLENVISFLLKRPIGQSKVMMEHLDRYMPYKEKLISILSKLADDFEPLFDRIVPMFENEDVIAQWKPALEEYIKEDTQRRYGLK